MLRKRKPKDSVWGANTIAEKTRQVTICASVSHLQNGYINYYFPVLWGRANELIHDETLLTNGKNSVQV